MRLSILQVFLYKIITLFQVLAEINKLQIQPKILLFHSLDGHLEVIDFGGLYPDLFGLNLGLDFQLELFNAFDDFLGFIGWDAVLDGNHLLDRPPDHACLKLAKLKRF